MPVLVIYGSIMTHPQNLSFLKQRPLMILSCLSLWGQCLGQDVLGRLAQILSCSCSQTTSVASGLSRHLPLHTDSGHLHVVSLQWPVWTSSQRAGLRAGRHLARWPMFPRVSVPANKIKAAPPFMLRLGCYLESLLSQSISQ